MTRDRQAVLDVFEAVFDHRSFTGRSGTMYGYEGLGCIYWHMVAKLLLAVQEVALRADPRGGVERDVRRRWSASTIASAPASASRRRVGEYGAFPTDPYSHTPAHAGAQQPGMTGQVKEEILTRFGELGVRAADGVVSFQPVLLRASEFRREGGRARFHDLEGHPISIEVPADGLAFTFCQVPIIYRRSRNVAAIRITGSDGEIREVAGDELDPETSQALLARCGGIAQIEVTVPDDALCRF